MSEIFSAVANVARCGFRRQSWAAVDLSLPDVARNSSAVSSALVTADQAHLTWTRGQPKLYALGKGEARLLRKNAARR